jgi:hypothetical protein
MQNNRLSCCEQEAVGVTSKLSNLTFASRQCQREQLWIDAGFDIRLYGYAALNDDAQGNTGPQMRRLKQHRSQPMFVHFWWAASNLP